MYSLFLMLNIRFKGQTKFQPSKDDSWDASIRSSILELDKKLPPHATICKEARKRKQASSKFVPSRVQNGTISNACGKNDYDSESDKNREGVFNYVHHDESDRAEQHKRNYLDMPEL